MKKWIITILLAVALLALALATHFWGARVIKFAVDNDKTVDSLKKLLEVLLLVGGLAPPVIKWLFGKKENGPKPGDAVSGDKKTVHDGDLVEGDKVGGDKFEGDKVGRDKITLQYQPAPPALPSPHQLPPPPADFTGRAAELAELRAAIEKGGVHISGLQGQGGVGKTALALKLAAELAPNYPDAQIYLDLKGVSEKPLTAAEAMSHILRTFHPEAKLPEKEEDLRALYLSMLHNKRALLVMDNAKDATQAEPLIPPRCCALLLTSRTRFHLSGLQSTHLDTLPPADAKDLLLEIALRIGDEADAIAKLCGYLPLALRLAARAIAERIDLSPPDYRQKLSYEKNRLKLLGGDKGIEASITLSYNLLDAETQKRWQMLAVFPDTFETDAAVAVWDVEIDAGAETLSCLLQYSMLEWNNSTKRYRQHDLMRAFARHRLPPAESDAAALRHAAHYGAILAAADKVYLKGGDSVMRGLALFDLEVGNIQAGQGWAAAHAEQNSAAAQLCNDYPDWGTYVLSLRQHPRERIHWRDGALAAAQQLKDRAAEAYHLGTLGLVYRQLGQFHRAIEQHEKCLAIFREIGDRRAEGAALGNLGNDYIDLGDAPRAIAFYEQRLAIAREIGDRRGEGNALGNVGLAYAGLGEVHRAVEYYKQSLLIKREIGDRRGESDTLGNLGNSYSDLGETRGAIGYYQQALDISRKIGDRRCESIALWNMSLVLDKLGDRKKAIEHAEAALKIKEQIEDPNAEEVRKQLDIWRNG